MVMTPHNFRGGESSDDLKVAGGPISQFVASTVKRPLWTFMNYLDTGNTDNAEGMGAGAPEFAEVAASEIGGVLIKTSNDAYSHLWFLPPEIDLTKVISFRVFWSESGSGGSGSALWVVKHTELITETTAVQVGATNLGTVIVADTPIATADAIQASAQGVMAANTLTAGGQGVNAVAIMTACTLTTITDASGLMLEVEYDRRFVG